MKQCAKCLIYKPNSEYYARKTGKRIGETYNHCKNCLKARGKEYYSRNHDRQLLLANIRRKNYREERRKIIIKLKNKPCSDCGILYEPYVMDFDHKNNTNKRGNIANLVNRNFITIEKLIEEISKCDLVCANCHRIRTFSRRNQNNELK